MFGGNSNWRGPVWMPLNYLAIRQFVIYHAVLRRRLHARVPDRLGRAAHASARSPRTSPTGSSRSGCPDPTAAGPCSAGRERLQTRPGLEGQPVLLRVLPRRQRRRPRRDAPDRLDGARRRPDPRPAERGCTARTRRCGVAAAILGRYGPWRLRNPATAPGQLRRRGRARAGRRAHPCGDGLHRPDDPRLTKASYEPEPPPAPASMTGRLASTRARRRRRRGRSPRSRSW